jgi:hypothetical protein
MTLLMCKGYLIEKQWMSFPGWSDWHLTLATLLQKFGVERYKAQGAFRRDRVDLEALRFVLFCTLSA